MARTANRGRPSGGKVEAVTPLLFGPGHQLHRLAQQVCFTGGSLGIAAASCAPGRTPLPSSGTRWMGPQFLFQPLVDSGQGPRFCINQQKADRGWRQCRDNVRSADLAGSHFSNALCQNRIDFGRTKVGSHADDRNRILQPSCFWNLKVEKDPEQIFFHEVPKFPGGPIGAGWPLIGHCFHLSRWRLKLADRHRFYVLS